MEATKCDDGVYGLVTKLCEHQLVKNNKRLTRDSVKKLRRKAFEALLTRNPLYQQDDPMWLENCNDYHCQFLAWEFMMRNNYDMQKEADSIENCVVQLLGSKCTNQDAIQSILHFLLKLKQMPKLKQTIIDSDINLTKGNAFRLFKSNEFALEDGLLFKNSPLPNFSFTLPKSKHNFSPILKRLPTIPSSCECELNAESSTSYNWIPSDEGYESPTSHIHLWDNISDMQFTKRRTWESCGDPVPAKEAPFCSEAEPSVYALMNQLQLYKKLRVAAQRQAIEKEPESSTCPPPVELTELRILNKEEFVKDLKLLVVGLGSGTFPKDGNYFRIDANVIFEGFSQHAYQDYCNLMVNCGICYKALSDMALNETEKNTARRGYIYEEFCAAIDRYLLFYRIAALNYKATNGLFAFHAHIRQLSQHLFVIASICKVGAYQEEHNTVPHGMQLINYLFTNVFSHVNKTILLVLYSILFPCLQMYFMRFLRPWLIEGHVHDPYNEFFIRTTHKYLETKSRTYWTRSFTICDEMVPDFLQDFKQQIFDCGKVMNMLRLCVPKSIVCEYAMGKQLNIIHCCMTSEQLTKLENSVRCYQLEIHALGGPSFSLQRMLAIQEDEKLIFSKLAVAKQAVTIKRIELKKIEKAEKQAEAKRKVMKILRDEYERAMTEKEELRLAELARELKENEKLMKMREKEQRIIKEEAEKMIAYYNGLAEKADMLTASIENHIETIKAIQLSEEPDLTKLEPSTIESDAINANDVEIESVEDELCDNHNVQAEINSNSMTEMIIQTADEQNSNVTESDKQKRKHAMQKNKEKYLREELGLTAAQINRNRVMGSSNSVWDNDPHLIYKAMTEQQRNTKKKEMDTGCGDESFKTQRQLNKERNLESCLFVFDDHEEDGRNDNDVRANECNNNPRDTPTSAESNDNLLFDINFDVATYYPSVFTNCMKTPNFELQKSDSLFTTPASILSSATTPMAEEAVPLDVDFSKRFPTVDVKLVKVQFLDHCIRHSISMPLEVQGALIKKDLLRYFIVDLRYLEHLEYLRNYYFLLDGEYSRNLTEELFDQLYYLDNPVELLNVRTLKGIINSALDSSLKPRMETQRISFRINHMKQPHVLDLKDVHVLDCISLSYEIKWPLNVLLPTDTISKYDEIFKFLLSVSRITWVLKNIFKDMKMLVKLAGRDSKYLMLSNQFKKVHLFRHIMTHFVQTFQNYIVGEVLQSSWAEHQNALNNIETLDDLYTVHTSYVKKIYFLCLLNKKSAPMRKVIMHLFLVILKFYDYMRSREWIFFENEFIHPNFSKLSEIFANFMKQAKYFFKIGRKVARAAYQPQFVQLMDSLDVNKYYSELFKM